jgi:hypothetical protein
MISSIWVTLRLLVQPLDRHGTTQVSGSWREVIGPESASRRRMFARQAPLASTQRRCDFCQPSSGPLAQCAISAR